MISFPKLLAIAAIITHATAVPNSATSCQTALEANYENITIPLGGSANVPTPYLDLNYIGWTAVAIVDVAGVPISTGQPHSPPNSIAFQGSDDTRVHSFSVANGVKSFDLHSLYIGCVVAAGVGTPVGSANVPTDCTVQAVGTTLSGSMVSVDLIFTASVDEALFTFPTSFSKLTTVNFVLTATSATTGLATVDFDNVAYTVSTC